MTAQDILDRWDRLKDKQALYAANPPMVYDAGPRTSGPWVGAVSWIARDVVEFDGLEVEVRYFLPEEPVEEAGIFTVTLTFDHEWPVPYERSGSLGEEAKSRCLAVLAEHCDRLGLVASGERANPFRMDWIEGRRRLRARYDARIKSDELRGYQDG